jgi:ParB/RepB/Spo0J family partition protein
LAKKKLVVAQISLELIDGPETALRERIDGDKVRELAESIRSVGLQNPIIVAPRGERFEIVSGHRRFLAHKLLNAATIDCVVRELDGKGLLLARAVENLQREDLSPLETARVYDTLRREFDYTMEQIAESMGKNKMTVWKYLQLLELPVDFQQAVDKGILAMQTAAELVKIDDPDFRRFYLQSAVDNGITFAVAQMWVMDYEKSKAAKFYEQGGPSLPAELGPPMPPSYGACAACHGAVDLRDMRHLAVCPSCCKAIMSAPAVGAKA